LPIAVYLLGINPPKTPDGHIENTNIALLQVALGNGKNMVAETALGESEDGKERVAGDRPRGEG
jgi:hypothetical protein